MAGASKIKMAADIIDLARKVAPMVKPLVDNLDADAAAEKITTGSKTAAEKASKGLGAVESAAHATKDAVANKVDELNSKREDANARKALREARQSLLESAAVTNQLSEFVAAQGTLDGSSVSSLNVPGCFVVATYKKRNHDKDLTDYTGIYVGACYDLAQGVLLAASRKGNADVYADYKYRQNMTVFSYPCDKGELDGQRHALEVIFADERCYNC